MWLSDTRIHLCANRLTRDEYLPKWERGRVDMEHWWLGTLAMCQVGGEVWKEWEGALKAALHGNQRGFSEFDFQRALTHDSLLDEHGSWDTLDVWSRDGRVGVTAMAGLCLELCHHFEVLHKQGD